MAGNIFVKAAAVTAGLLLMALGPQPQGLPFDQSPQPAAPDYSHASSWMTFRHTEASPEALAADVFYIHPTTYRGREWNQDLNDAETNRWTDTSIDRRQVSAFLACCRAFAPRYRQASARAFVASAGDGAKAYDLAYGDVVRAFEYYLEHENGGRPFIIAGHSQGTLHGLRLVQEKIAGTPLAERMVAAYLPGIGIPQAMLGASLPVCATPNQTRCLVSWNSFDADADTADYVARSLKRYTGPAENRTLVCVNPMSFDVSRPAMGFGMGKGILPGPPTEGPLPALVHGKVAARCDGGVLRIEAAPGFEIADRLPRGNLHMADIALFWGDIRVNAQLRVKAWYAARTSR